MFSHWIFTWRSWFRIQLSLFIYYNPGRDPSRSLKIKELSFEKGNMIVDFSSIKSPRPTLRSQGQRQTYFIKQHTYQMRCWVMWGSRGRKQPINWPGTELTLVSLAWNLSWESPRVQFVWLSET